MIYHHAIGDKFLHISLDCTMTPYEIHRYNNRNSHRCHSRKVDQGKQSERGSTLLSYHGLTIYHDDPTKVIQRESTVRLLNRICSSRYADVGIFPYLMKFERDGRSPSMEFETMQSLRKTNTLTTVRAIPASRIV